MSPEEQKEALWIDRVEMAGHFVSESCGGETCNVCDSLATHKIAEEIMHDDPGPDKPAPPHQIRHPLTAYLCCRCFRLVVGGACEGKEITI